MGTQGEVELPIRKYAADIADAAKEHPIIVVIGETGSGKTTQISQILLDAGLTEKGQIAVTQPRRVAAVTVARRVAEERGVQLGREVGYTVRFEDCSCPDTKIKYLTDGTLLRECLEDPQLSRYSVVVLDEAHERSLNTDILFGVLKQLVATRTPPLKLVVTSATLDGEKFSAYFNACPVFRVPGRCYPVDVIHSLEDYQQAYVDAAVDVVLQLHTEQPPGDILVFLTGQAEITKAVAKIQEGVASLPDGSCGPLMLLPLYASLPPEMQVRVFRPAPPGVRRCIVATNVAETSVTVDGVVYVVDCGLAKVKTYQPATGMDSLDVTPTSRVSATQRAGRAGRTQPGKCFRLYTKSFFDRTMPDVTPPEIQRTSLAGAVLHLKSLALDIDVLTFDFLDPPSRPTVEDALRTLHLLDALDADGHVTAVGRAMAQLPLEPGLARCLLAAADLKCLPEVMSIAAMLSTDGVYEHGRGPTDGQNTNTGKAAAKGPTRELRELAAEGRGDHILMLRLWEAWAARGYSRDALKELGLDSRSMGFARDIRKQLEGVMMGYLSGKDRGHKRDQQPPPPHHQFSHPPPASEVAASGIRGPDDGAKVEAGPGPSSQAEGGRSRSSGRQGRSRERSRERSRSRGSGDRHRARPSSRERQRGSHRGSGGDDRSGARGGRDRERSRDRAVTSRDAARREPSGRVGEDGAHPRQQQQQPGVDALKPTEFPSESHRLAAVVKALTIGFAHKLARRLPRHNGYRTMGTGAVVGGGQLAQLHPACAGLTEDDDGLLPEWVVYHELVSTSRPFLRQVCATQYAFVEPLLPKIANMDVQRLSRSHRAGPTEAAPQSAVGAAAGSGARTTAGGVTGAQAPVKKKDDAAVDAARQRYLARKTGAGGKK